ncbi:MAG: glycogen-binding domain-containing protein [Psychromonas sp.]
MEYLISMYIDNELSIDDKISFVKHVHKDQDFTYEALSFLKQEKALRGSLAEDAPKIDLPFLERPSFSFMVAKPLKFMFAASVLILATLYFSFDPSPNNSAPSLSAGNQHRFVIYQSDIKQVEITGSFTNWQRIPLQPAGASGYWEITLEVPPGEHAFSYILDGDNIFADPTILAQEKDDFGTINSILIVEAS